MLKPLRSRGGLLGRIWVANILVFMASIISISISNYYSNTRIIDKHTSAMYQKMLTQTDYNIEDLYERVNQIGEQLLNDTEVIIGLYSNELNPVDSFKTDNRIQKVVSTNPDINSVYLYNSENDRFIHTIRKDVDIQDIDKEAIALIEARKKMKKMIFLPHKQSYTYESKSYDNNILSLIFTYSGAKNGYAIFINLKLSAITDLFIQMRSSEYSNFVIVDKNGLNIIDGEKPEKFMRDNANEEYIKRIIQAEAKSDHFIGEVNGKKSLINYVYNEKLEWYLINTTRSEYLSKDNRRILENIIFISVIILLISIAVTLLITNKIYTPFGKFVNMIKFSNPSHAETENGDEVAYVSDVFKVLINKVTTLEDSAVKDRDLLKSGLLRDMLNHEGRVERSEIGSAFRKFNIRLQPNDLRALVFYIVGESENIPAEEMDRMDSRMAFVKEAMYEFALRVFSDREGLEKVETGSHSFVLLMNDIEGNKGEAQISEFLYRVENLMDIRLKIGVGVRAASVQELPRSYETAKDALNYRFIDNDKSVYSYEEIQANIRKQALYPVKLEQALIHQLKLNDTRGAQQIVDELFEEIKLCAIKDIYVTLQRLGSKIDNEFNEIIDFAPFCSRYEYGTLAEAIENLSHFDRLYRFFSELVDYLVHALRGNRYRDSKEIVKKACEYIQQHYRNGDLSADSVAVSLGISVPYFSKLFNENLRVTFTTYVTNLRLIEAEDLLVNTSLQVREISENIGFLNSTYFITVFKKKHGVSPNQYRQLKKAN